MWRAMLAMLVLTAGAAMADERLIEDFGPGAGNRWEYLGDPVMGGVSTGRAELRSEAGTGFIRLTGSVSTANNGGFIQTRLKMPTPLPEEAQGLSLRLRGNGERYFVHLRTRATRMPWQYYQAEVPSGPEWQEVRVPFSAFVPSGQLLPGALRPGSVRSIGLVAFGRDHAADVSLARLSWY